MGIFYKNKQNLFKQQGDKYFVVNQEKGTLIHLNETSFFLWKNLKKRLTALGLLKLLIDEYDIASSEAKSDIEEFLKMALKSGIIEKVK